MKRFFTLAFLFVAAMPAFAQNKKFSANDPDAKAILDAVSRNLRSHASYSAAFTFKAENASGKTLETRQGTIRLKGQKYRMALNGQDFISDGSTIWTFDKSANEVTINKFDQKGSTLTPQKLFTDFYAKDFLYKQNPDTKLNGKAVKEVELTPTDKSKPYFKVLLWIANNSIAGARIYEKSGSRFSYVVNSYKVNPALPDADFAFNAASHPGVEVVDLR